MEYIPASSTVAKVIYEMPISFIVFLCQEMSAVYAHRLLFNECGKIKIYIYIHESENKSQS